MFSSLATPIFKPRIALKREGKPLLAFPESKGHWFGICVHTTGRGVPNMAKRLNKTPGEIGVLIYSKLWQSCPHYLIDPTGMIHGITDEKLVAPHCGVKAWQRNQMLDGSWVDHVSSKALYFWNRRWLPRFKSPQHLFPGESGNRAYIGIEMIPSLTLIDGSFFNSIQYDTLSALISDIRIRHNMNDDKNKLVGHEDLQPYERWDNDGGWDPGALRQDPYFFWDRLHV